METVTSIAQKVMTGLSLVTALGVFMHDGRVDKATVIAVTTDPIEVVPAPTPDAELGSMAMRLREFAATDAHTHPDHNAAKAGLMNSFAYQNPSIPPRTKDQKRHMLQEYEPRGRHAFDNTNLPMTS